MISKRIQEQLKKGSPIREAFEEGQRLAKIYGAENVFDFSIGNPYVEAPKKVKESIQKIIEQNPRQIHSYMNDAGYEDVREKIAESLNRRFGTSFHMHNIIMSVGAAGAMNAAMYALMDVDDEVMVMRPYYPGYTSFILNWQGKKVEVDPDPQTFQPDFEDFESKITERTKLVIVNSPNNPTGAIYTEDTIQRLAQILEKKEQAYGHEIYLLSDEPYRELVYTGETLPYLTKYYNNTLVAYSFSKSLSVPGERIGYLVIPDEASESQMLIKAVKMTTGMIGYVNAPSLFQKVVAECLDEKANLEFYQKNRDILYKKLCDLGFEVVPPSGAFYIFIKAPGGDEKRFLEKAHECNILLVGGSFFGYVGYARISFCVSHEKILRSLAAFEKLAELMRE